MEKAVTREDLVEELHLVEMRGTRTRKAQRVAEDVEQALSRPPDDRPWSLGDELEVGEGGDDHAAAEPSMLDPDLPLGEVLGSPFVAPLVCASSSGRTQRASRGARVCHPWSGFGLELMAAAIRERDPAGS